MARKTVVHTVLPIEHPDRPRSLFADVPLFCGREKTSETITTHFPSKITCKRCKALQTVYDEDLDYRRTMQRLEIQRGIEART